MAGSTITFTPSSANGQGSYIEGKIAWTSELNASTNASRVTARIYIRKYNPKITLTDPTSGTWSYTFTVGDYTKSETFTKSVGTTWLEITSLTMTVVKHNADGSKSIKIAGSITAPSGTSYSGLTTSGSKTVALDLNQHPTKIDSLTCNTKYVDGTISVKYTPQTNTFCHKCIVYVNVGGSLTHISTEELDPTAVTQQTHTLKVGDGDLTKVYEKVTNTATAKIRVTLQTYSDSTYSKKVGDDQYKEISLELPEGIAPTAKIEVTPVNSNSWLASQDIYVAGLSGARVTVTATPGTKATIDLNSIAYNGTTYNGGAVNTYARDVPTFKKAGEIEFAAVVMDSRGRYVTKTIEIDVLPYSAPTIASVQFERGTLEDGWKAVEEGKDVQVTFKTNLSLADFAENNNYYTANFKVDGSDAQQLVGEKHKLASGVDCTVYLLGIDGEASHTLTVTATDRTNNKGAVTLTIPTRHITMEFYQTGKGIAFGKTSEKESFECAWDADFKKNVNIEGELTIKGTSLSTLLSQSASVINENDDGSVNVGNTSIDIIVAQGTSAINHTVDGVTARSGTWTYRKWSSGIMECWGIGNVNVKVNMTWSGTGLYYGVVSTINFPFTFTEIPVCTVDVAYGDDDKSLVVASCGRGTNVYARPIMLCRNTSGTVNCDLHYHAIGRWK